MGRAGGTESGVAASHCTYRFEFGDGVPIVAKLPKDGFIVGAQQGRRRGRFRVSAGEAKACAHDGDVAIDIRGLKMLYEPSLAELRMIEHFGYGENFTSRHTMLVQ
jgi:hypothetical protein